MTWIKRCAGYVARLCSEADQHLPKRACGDCSSVDDDLESANRRTWGVGVIAAQFYYEAHLFMDREGTRHFTFEVPHALGQGVPFTRYSKPASDEAAQAALEAAIEDCRRALNTRGVPYTLEPKHVE
jgi:hypothetical protein